MNKPKKNWLEWTVFAIGLMAVASTLAYLVYEGLTLDDRPPQIEVRLGAPVQQADGYTVPVTVSNRGDRAAEGVIIKVFLEGVETEEAEFEIAFLPRRATREGWVFFRQDPRGGKLAGRVLGYEQP